MIPLSLSIEGLYSYREKQTINFEKLTSNGLFGIFGEVGSGKSSILEAIMFVLFDDTERLNKSGDERYYNMLNLQRNRFSIDFTFLAGKGNQEKYRFACSAKRNSKPEKFKEVKMNDRQFYRWEAGQWMPLQEVKEASQILGMDYKNFMQTVIIPQGKFREFVDQTSGDRTKMLKELFRLHHFDLSKPTNQLQKAAELEIKHLQGQLESLGDTKAEDIEKLREEVALLTTTISKLQQQIGDDKKEEQELKSLSQLHTQLLETRQHLHRLEEALPQWKEREQKLKTYSNAYTHFYEKFRQQHTLKEELTQKQEAGTRLQAQWKESREQQQQAKKRYEEARKTYEGKEQIQRKIEDLERSIQLKATEEKLEEERQKQQKQAGDCKKLAAQKQAARESYEAMEARFQKMEAELPDISRLSEALQWVEKKEHTQKQLQKAESNLIMLREELQGNQQQQKQLLQGWPELATTENWEDLFSGIEQTGTALSREESRESETLRELHVQQKLSEYAIILESGKACPLCGATEHPELAVSEHIVQACQKQEDKIKACRQKQQQLHQLHTGLTALQANMRHLEGNQQRQQQELQEYRQQQQTLEQSFAWPEYRQTEKQELKRQMELAGLASQQLKTLKMQLTTAKKEAEAKAAKYEVLNMDLQQTERRLSGLEGEAEAKKGALHLNNQRLLRYDTDTLKENLKKGKENLLQLIQQYEQSQQTLNQLNEQTARLQAQQESATQSVEELQAKQQQLQKEIEENCTSRGFESPQKVREILALRLNIEEEERQIKEYQQQLHSVKDLLKKLEEQAAGRRYDKEAHQRLLQRMEQQEQQCEMHKRRKTQAEHQKADKEEKFRKSKELQKTLEKEELRRDNLKELSSLFYSNGFVDYVSTIYLQDLCQVANERFFKLTRNNLSLELSDQNSFIVRDYLNGGRTRLLKTLSGGQTFQASLCLALAMAENIKSLNEAEQSFFFLDEGFGALDKESLRIVFDTLKSLRQENRIVGVISHVEELQQEIEVYLKVENDPEKGSLVRCSWE